MFNFTTNPSNALADVSKLPAEVSEKYDAAMKKIEQLERELKQKTLELDKSSTAQSVMREGVKSCTESLCTVQNQLLTVAAHLERSNKHIFKLMQENKTLKSSGDVWFKRAIKLEFEVLMTQDSLKKIEHERNLAIKTCELLQVELMSVDKENSQGRNQN